MAAATKNRRVEVEGLGSLLRALDREPKELRSDIRKALRAVAVPAQKEAQALFMTKISAKTGASRYGISLRKGREAQTFGATEVAASLSVEQRVKRSVNTKRRRPTFAADQKRKALQPAADHAIPNMDRESRLVVQELERRWSRTGI